MNKDAEIQHGKAIAAQAERVWQRDTLAGKRRIQNRADLFRAFMDPLSPRAAVLEIGCGTGSWTEVLAGSYQSLTSMDLSEDLLNVARRKDYANPVTFLCGDVDHLPFLDRHFDVVCGLSILHHLDLKVVLPEMYRVLKPRGKFWFSEPNMLNPQIMVQKNIPIIKRWSGDTPDETAFFRWALTRDLLQTGFTDVLVKPFDFLHPQVPGRVTDAVDRFGRFLETVPFLREFAGSLLIQGRRPGTRDT